MIYDTVKICTRWAGGLGPLTAFLAICLTIPAVGEPYSGVRYLDNGIVRIGLNLDIGGAITYLSESGSDENIINSHDWGRQIQMSFYSGPTPFTPNGKEPHPVWRGLGWNPIQSGDCYGNESRVIDFSSDGESIYVKCIPMQWPLENVPGECTFETWITLDGKTARVRSKINNARTDKTQFPGRGQELPAIYTNGPYYRLFSYNGNEPFSNGPLHHVTKVWDTSKGVNVEGGPWDDWYATESWAALVRDDNWGVGVWTPGTYSYKGGFAGKPGKGGPKDAPTGYIAPIRREILDHNIEYDYEYVLIVGKLDEIRQHVYEQSKRVTLPDTTFDRDRQGWTIRNGNDSGWPLQDGWQVQLNGGNAALVGPSAYWNAKDMPRLYVRAAFAEGTEQAIIHWERFGKTGQERYGNIRFDVVPDGQMRTYEIDLSAVDSYRGPCTRLLLAPADMDTEGGSLQVEYISHRSRD